MSSPLPRELRGVEPRLSALGPGALRQPRLEHRRRALQAVELTAYPRLRSEHVARMGIALDESDSGLCVALDAAQRVKTLMRVVVRDLDGVEVRDGLWRVVWCEPASEGGYTIGLTRLPQSEPHALEVRHERRRVQIAVEPADG